MRHKIINYILAIEAVLAVELFLAIAVIVVWYSPVQISYAKPVAFVDIKSAEINSTDAIWNITYPKLIISGLPMRLQIPKIKVNAIFETVGLTAQGAVGVPKKYANVAWFNVWPRPGEVGTAIVTGHYGKVNGKASVFDNLNNLRAGDKIYIEDDRGAVMTFVVRKIKSFGEKEDVPEIFSSSDGGSHLNIITCEGKWNNKTKSYSKRLVIFTDREQ